MGDWKTLNIALGALPKVVSVGALGLALVYFLWSGNFKNIAVLSRFFLLFCSVIVGIILWSILIWILDFQTISFILKGVSKTSYQFLNISIVISAVYLFEEKAAKYTFFGIAAANFVIIILGAIQTGVGGAIKDLVSNIMSFGANDVVYNSKFIRAIEIHDITFVMGVYVIYFLFFCHGERYRFLYAGIALFLFMAGLKRIAFLSMTVAIVFAVFCCLLNSKGKKRLLIITSFLVVGLCFYYVTIIQSGLFTRFCEEHDIELNGREKIYDFISHYYRISPSYRGHGYEFCAQLLKSMKGTKDQVLAVGLVHNDILKMYVELGFWGFVFWILWYYVYQTHWYITRCGKKTAVCFMTLSIYMLFSYMTDNTMFYYWSSMVIRMIPLCFFFDPVKDIPLKIKDNDEMTKFERWLYAKNERNKESQQEIRLKLK